MSLRISTGIATLYDKETPDFAVARVNVNLMETESTKYSKKKWWGDFSVNEELRHLGNYLIGFEDARKGECIVIANTEASSKKSKTWYYHFNGRGGLGRK
jgi:hypothetical protein